MSENYIGFWEVESDSKPGKTYRVSETAEGQWQCACRGWTMHTPRKDCKHITWVKCGQGVPLDPLARAVAVAQKKHGCLSMGA